MTSSPLRVKLVPEIEVVYLTRLQILVPAYFIKGRNRNIQPAKPLETLPDSKERP